MCENEYDGDASRVEEGCRSSGNVQGELACLLAALAARRL